MVEAIAIVITLVIVVGVCDDEIGDGVVERGRLHSGGVCIGEGVIEGGEEDDGEFVLERIGSSHEADKG
jgi:hypothetical protein